MRTSIAIIVPLTVLLSAVSVASQDPHAAVQHRGAKVMGFDQVKTIHHFILYTDGGAIDVSVKDRSNAADLGTIRSHLPHISARFAEGNFDAPMLVHESTNVPGTADMARLRAAIAYRYVETPWGGRVDIVTTDPAAIAAVHAFLKFQIADHKTRGSSIVRKR